MTSTASNELAIYDAAKLAGADLHQQPTMNAVKKPCFCHYILVGMHTCSSSKKQYKKDRCSKIWFLTEELEVNRFFCHGVEREKQRNDRCFTCPLSVWEMQLYEPVGFLRCCALILVRLSEFLSSYVHEAIRDVEYSYPCNPCALCTKETSPQ